MNKKVFLTGASGFIGANLAKRLFLDGYEVAVLLREHSYHPFLEGIRVKRFLGDITDKMSIENSMRGCKYVYHCAAKISFNRHDYENLYCVNVLGTRNVLDIALRYKVEKFIHISACAVFGYSRDKIEIIDENSIHKIPTGNVYAYTKKLAEAEVAKYCSKGLNAVIANPCTVYGQGDRRLNSGSLIKAVYNNKLKLVPPGGTSVVSVDDLVNGLILMFDKGRKGENYIFANENIEYIDLINKIANIIHAKQVIHKIAKLFYHPAVWMATVVEFVNRNSIFITSQTVKELFKYKYFSSNKSRKELGWKPGVSVEEAIKNAFEFYKTYRLL